MDRTSRASVFALAVLLIAASGVPPLPAQAVSPPALSDVVGTWQFRNPRGDDEQMSIFAEGQVMIFYSNGHVDDDTYANGTVRVREFGDDAHMHLRQFDAETLTGVLMTSDGEPAGLAKVWVRVDETPQRERVIEESGVQTAQAAPPPPAPDPQRPPSIVETLPAIGAHDVDPALTEIRVTFDQDMAGGFSWTGGGEVHPEITDRPRWETPRTCVLPVRLERAHFYRLGINSSSHRNFRSQAGRPTPPRAIWFCTQGASDDDLAALSPPQPVEIIPAPGSTDVDPSLAELRITFDQPMGGGRSVTGGGDTFPPMVEGASYTWSEDRRTLSWPVNLAPNHEYHFGINSFSHVNFQSDHGVPAGWTRVRFQTRAE